MAKIDKDLEITVVNNIRGSFVYSNRGTIIELYSFGDEDFLTYGELKTMVSGRYKSLLQNFSLLITDVDSDEYTLEDVIKQLKLSKYYEKIKSLTDEDDSEVDQDVFEDFIRESKVSDLIEKLSDENLKYPLVDTAVELYKNKDFNDYDKRKAVADAIGVGTGENKDEDFDGYFRDIPLL